jgi:hypothetical protein
VGLPPAQDQGDRPISQDPFAIKFSGNMNMGASGNPTFTGRVANLVVRRNPGACWNAAFCGYVKVKDGPTSLFVPIAV